MSLLSRINRGAGAPPADESQPGLEGRPEASVAPMAGLAPEAAAPAVATSALSTSDAESVFWPLFERLGAELEGIGPLLPAADRTEREVRTRAIEDRVLPVLQAEGIRLTPTERAKLCTRLFDEVFAFGPVEPLLDDPTVRRIVANGPGEVMAERYGGLESTSASFRDNEHLTRIIRRIAVALEAPLDAGIPRMTITLGEGEKVTAVLPPLASVPTLTITKGMGNPFRNLQTQKETAGITAIEAFYQLKYRLLERLIAQLDQEFLARGDQTILRRQVQEIILRLLDEQGIALNRNQRNQVVLELLDEVTGLGPLEQLLRDASVSEIMVNGPKQVWYESRGKLHLSDRQFRDDEHLVNIIQKICSAVGRRVDEASPLVDARLRDGSRVNAVVPPIAIRGASLTIRKFSKDPLTIDNLVTFGTLTPEISEFLRAAVLGRLNIIVSGGTGSGKTTLLNCLSGFIPQDERIVTIEDAAELQLKQPHVVTLEARPANIEGKGAVSIRDLVANALRMRPDRIGVGECRGGEALVMLLAMNTGHDGSLTTGHANSPREMLSRLETMVLMAGMELPVRAIREQITAAVDLIIQTARLRDGSRRITYITEITNMEGDVITLQDIFVLRQLGMDQDGRLIMRHEPTGIRPRFMEQIEEAGITLPASVFNPPREGRFGA
ncbi:MAG: CpaF family protein [Armatimonadetes bacterium]|nr:CpaF family protein [Armatimonadota bacterium]